VRLNVYLVIKEAGSHFLKPRLLTWGGSWLWWWPWWWHKAWQGITRHDKAWQDITRNDKERQGMTRHDKAWQGMTRHDKAWQGTTRNNKERQGKTRHTRQHILTLNWMIKVTKKPEPLIIKPTTSDSLWKTKIIQQANITTKRWLWHD